MKTKAYHITNLGAFAPHGCAGRDGYVTYHDSPRYADATDAQLEQWVHKGRKAVRNAALTEIAERQIEQWRESGAWKK